MATIYKGQCYVNYKKRYEDNYFSKEHNIYNYRNDKAVENRADIHTQKKEQKANEYYNFIFFTCTVVK